MEISSDAERKSLDVVLISAESGRVDRLRSDLEAAGISASLRHISGQKDALAFVKRSGARRDAEVPDLIVVDLTEPADEYLVLLGELAGMPRGVTPWIVLTTPTSERWLDARLDTRRSTMFAPMTLRGFLDKVRRHDRGQLKRALFIVAEFGPVRVRVLPDFAQQTAGGTGTRVRKGGPAPHS